jgi:integrase
MAAKLEATKTAGVYRRGARYAVIYRDGEGRQRQESARTYDEARRLRARRAASIEDGSYQPQTRERFADYGRQWIERYPGNGRRGFTEDTRKDYRRDLERYAIPFLGRLRLEQITPRHIAEYIAWLCDERQQDRRLADATVRRILAPVRACLRSAMLEGVIRSNPTQGAALPVRDEHQRIEDGTDDLGEDHDVRALTTEQLAALMLVVPQRHRLLVQLLGATGLRISEGLALRWGDLALDGDRPVVRVRRGYVRGHFKAPKSKYGRRVVPIDFELVRALRKARPAGVDERALVFAGQQGAPLHASNLLVRVLKPAVQEVGAPWAGFHTLRHTCASRLFAAGRNPVQVQRWLGHHSPAFTLSVYAHLMDDDLGEPLALPAAGVSAGVSGTDGLSPHEPVASLAELA